MLPVGTDAALHRIDDVQGREPPDAVLGIRRDVGRPERAEGRREGLSADPLELLVALGLLGRMAGCAAGLVEDVFSMLGVGGVRRQGRRVQRMRRGQNPKAGGSGQDEDHVGGARGFVDQEVSGAGGQP